MMYFDNHLYYHIKHYNQTHYFDLIDYYSSITPAFLTKNGKRILFTDFSVGQQSSNYLRAKLDKSDNRKHIVLFDEIGSMDNESMNNVVERLKELDKEKKLVLAILVKPHEEPNMFEIKSY